MVMATDGARRGSSPGNHRAASQCLAVVLGLGAAWFGPVVGAWPYGPPAPQPLQTPGPFGQPPPGNWQFRPQPPTNAQGTPPVFTPGPMPNPMPGPGPGYAPYPGGMPGRGPYSGPFGPRTAESPPRLEATLDEPEPYVQQPLLLRLRLGTPGNPTEATLTLPATGDALLQRLDGPTPEPHAAEGGRREIVNGFIVRLIPLRSGTIEIPPIRVNGSMPGAGGGPQRFEAATNQPIRLQVRPAMTAVTPWLPLKSLTLKSDIDRDTPLVPGQPLTLMVESVAVGGTAEQLPSLEDQLEGPDYRVYREQILTESGLSADRRDLVGRRTEYYTLVPQSSGRLTLPEILVPWWNTDSGRRELASVPMRTLQIGGESGPFGMPASVMSARDWGIVWLPLIGLVLLLAGYWGGVFYGTRRGPSGRPRLHRSAGPAKRLAAFAGRIHDRWARVAHHLRPEPLIARIRDASAAALPPSSRFLRCVRHANRAPDPTEWCDRFEADARSRLRFQGEATQPNLTRLILSLRPHADPVALSRLMQALDAALYGRRSLDFEGWKRDFMREVGRGAGLRPSRWRRGRIKASGLPALNPGH